MGEVLNHLGLTEAKASSADSASFEPKTRNQNSRSRQRADTKERIFETALREFREVGFAAAQIDRIAKRAGVARGTFYFHFPTKDDVMLELARRINRRGAVRLALVVETQPRLREFLSAVVDILNDEFGRVSDAGLNSDLLSLYLRRPQDLKDPLRNAPSIHDELVGYLREISAHRELPLSTSPERLALLIMSSLFGILARLPRGEELRGACHSLVDLFVKGLESDQ